MEKQKHNVTKDQRVRLKDGPDQLYRMAPVGSEGWVRQEVHDEFGYPMVYIEWDKKHWTYNGERDQWAFASHFDPVETEMSNPPFENPEEFANAMAAFFSQYTQEKQAKVEPTPEPEPAPKSQPTPEPLEALETVDPDTYARDVETAFDVMKGAESFLLIAAQREEIQGEEVLVPRALNAYKSVESGFLVELQLPHLVTAGYQTLAVEKIREALGRGGKK